MHKMIDRKSGSQTDFHCYVYTCHSLNRCFLIIFYKSCQIFNKKGEMPIAPLTLKHDVTTLIGLCPRQFTCKRSLLVFCGARIIRHRERRGFCGLARALDVTGAV